MEFALGKEQEKFIPKMVEAMTYEEALFIMEEVMDDYRPTGGCEIAFRKALTSLEKQIPKKPIFVHVREFVGDRVYKCPSCGGPLGVKSFALRQGTIGCSRCLQAIDWSEVDD